MLIWHKLGIHSEEEEKEGIVEETIDGAEEPEGDQEVEKVLDDELEGWKVENEEDEDRGGDAVEDVGNCVF